MNSGYVCRRAVLLPLCLLGGCALARRPVAWETSSFAAASVTGTQDAADAYVEATRLHAEEQTALAVLNYDSQPNWNPQEYAKPLLSPSQLAQRTAILQALQRYATLVAELASKKGSADLQAASNGVADSFASLGQTVATRFATALPNAPTLSDTQTSTLGGALGKLAEILRERRVGRRLPAILASADPQIASVCAILVSDVDVLRSQADRDYVTLEETQDRYLRDPRHQLGPAERRLEIARLPEMVRAQQQNDALLAQLQDVLRNLALAHHALATAAQQQGRHPVADAQMQQLSAAAETLRSLTRTVALSSTTAAFP